MLIEELTLEFFETLRKGIYDERCMNIVFVPFSHHSSFGFSLLPLFFHSFYCSQNGLVRGISQYWKWRDCTGFWCGNL